MATRPCFQDKEAVQHVLGLADRANGAVYAQLATHSPYPPEFVYGASFQVCVLLGGVALLLASRSACAWVVCGRRGQVHRDAPGVLGGQTCRHRSAPQWGPTKVPPLANPCPQGEGTDMWESFQEKYIDNVGNRGGVGDIKERDVLGVMQQQQDQQQPSKQHGSDRLEPPSEPGGAVG